MPRFASALDIVQVSDPATPVSGRQYLYFKSDGFLYSRDSAGTVRQIGSGATAANVVVSTLATAHKETVAATAPATPAVGDLWLDSAAVVAIPRMYPLPIDIPPATPNAMDDEFSGSALDAKWSLFNTPTVGPFFNTNGFTATSIGAPPTAGWALRGITQPLPVGDFLIAARWIGVESSVFDYNRPVVMALLEGTTAQRAQLISARAASGGSNLLETPNLSNATTYVGVGSSGAMPSLTSGIFWVRRVGTTYTMGTSFSGVNIGQGVTFTSSALGYTPATVLLGSNAENATYGASTLWDWFRRLS